MEVSLIHFVRSHSGDSNSLVDLADVGRHFGLRMESSPDHKNDVMYGHLLDYIHELCQEKGRVHAEDVITAAYDLDIPGCEEFEKSFVLSKLAELTLGHH